MDTSFNRIRAKIAELEAKLADLRIAERELQDLDRAPPPKAKRKPKENRARQARQTIGAAIAEVLSQHGALSAGEIAEYIKAAGRNINKRSVSYSLQAMKKQGRIKNDAGKWTLPKAHSRTARA